MNINRVLQTLQALKIVDGNTINKAVNMQKNYSGDINGFMKGVQDVGGMDFLNKNLNSNFLNHPIAKTIMGVAGIKSDTINNCISQIKNFQGGTGTSQSNSSPANDYAERLKKYK